VNALRPPIVAGVGGGVGTTTLAVALRGHDAGRERGISGEIAADILACRGTLDSVRRAAALLERTGPGLRPVLAVTLDGAWARGPLRARLRLLEVEVSALVLLPHVGRWRTLADPFAEVAGLLVEPDRRLPRPLRAYAAALREVAAAVADSGRLHAPPATPLPRAPRPGEPHAPATRHSPDTDPARPRPAPVVGALAPPDGGPGPAAGRAPGQRRGRAADPTPDLQAGVLPPVIGSFRPVFGTSTTPQPSGGVRIVAPPPRSSPVRPLPAGVGDGRPRSGARPARRPLAGMPDLPAEQVG
jgi:hypothetical protein